MILKHPKDDRGVVFDRMRKGMEFGYSLSEAVTNEFRRRGAADSAAQIADSLEITSVTLSKMLGGYPGRAYPETRKVLARRLGIRKSQLDELIEWEAENNSRKAPKA